MKNNEYLSWDEYFMGIAILSSKRSKDPTRKVGCCIVDSKTKHIISIGYNGLPYGLNDDDFAWEKTDDFESNKGSYVVHAEANAILNASTTDLENSVVYITLFPCNECAKLLAQKRVGKVIYLEDYPEHPERVNVSTKILEKAGVLIEKYEK